MTPEFSRAVRLDTIGEGDRTVEIAADADERRRVAGRFALAGVDRLEGRFTLRRDAAGVIATGHVSASVVQTCSVTGDPLPARVEEAVTLRFVEETVEGEEIELSEDALDTLPIENGAVDLGEAAAETMALALDPFPRSPDAEATLREAGIILEGEGTTGAFSGLAALKRRPDG